MTISAEMALSALSLHRSLPPNRRWSSFEKKFEKQWGVSLMTFHHETALTNVPTSKHRDPITGTPEYKSCAVKVQKAL